MAKERALHKRDTVKDSHTRTRLTSNYPSKILQISFSVPKLFVFHRDHRHYEIDAKLEKFWLNRLFKFRFEKLAHAPF